MNGWHRRCGPVRTAWYLALLLGWLGWWGSAWATTATTTTLTLDRAKTTVMVHGETIRSDVTLPYSWDSSNPGQRGVATFDLEFALPQVPDGVWGIYLPSVGNAYEIWLNGTLLQRVGSMASQPNDLQAYNGSDSARVPHYVSVAAGHFQAFNRLRVDIRADIGRRGGLAPILIGPQDEVFPLYTQNYRWRVTAVAGLVAFSLVVGLTALALWSGLAGLHMVGRLRRDPLYLLAAVAQLFWAAYVGDGLFDDPPLRWPWWGILQSGSMGIWGSSMALACMELADWRAQSWAVRFRRWLLILMVLCPGFVWLTLAQGQTLALSLWYGAFGLSLLVFVLVFLWCSARQSRVEYRVVAVVGLINILVALRDIYVFRIDPVYGSYAWVRYSSVLFGLALGYVALLRFRATSQQLRDLLANLASRVADKERALRDSYDRLETLARQQERTAERSRILRNMHDGVGSHISSAMRQLQAVDQSTGTVDKSEVLLTLRDAMDQLKLSIDAIHLVPGDVTALLANLRYRLGPRFTAMGIELQWDVDLLPLCPQLDSAAMTELQFMLFESLSNVLQHAHAQVLRIEAHSQPGNRIFVRVIDDGRGFDAESCTHKGLASLRQRATAMGAELAITSEPGTTVVEIQLTV